MIASETRNKVKDWLLVSHNETKQLIKTTLTIANVGMNDSQYEKGKCGDSSGFKGSSGRH